MQGQGFSHPVIVVAASVKMIDSAVLSASNMRACILVLQWNIPSDRAWAGLKCFFEDVRSMQKVSHQVLPGAVVFVTSPVCFHFF